MSQSRLAHKKTMLLGATITARQDLNTNRIWDHQLSKLLVPSPPVARMMKLLVQTLVTQQLLSNSNNNHSLQSPLLSRMLSPGYPTGTLSMPIATQRVPSRTRAQVRRSSKLLVLSKFLSKTATSDRLLVPVSLRAAGHVSLVDSFLLSSVRADITFFVRCTVYDCMEKEGFEYDNDNQGIRWRFVEVLA